MLNKQVVLARRASGGHDDQLGAIHAQPDANLAFFRGLFLSLLSEASILPFQCLGCWFVSNGRPAAQKRNVFKIQKSKPIIDEIDRVLAKHYGFTEEKLDFIINYDIKYRMGRDAGGEEE